MVEQSEDLVQFAGAVRIRRCIVYLSKCDKVPDRGRREAVSHEVRLCFHRHFASSNPTYLPIMVGSFGNDGEFEEGFRLFYWKFADFIDGPVNAFS